MGVVRSTCVIDEEGTIVYAAEKVKPDQDRAMCWHFCRDKEPLFTQKENRYRQG